MIPVMRSALALCLASLLVLTGCVRARDMSVVNDNGTMSRSLSIEVSTQGEAMGAPPLEFSDIVTFADADLWNVSEEETDDAKILTATAAIAEGESRDSSHTLTDGDITVKCETAFTKQTDGGWEWTQTYTCLTPLTDDEKAEQAAFDELFRTEAMKLDANEDEIAPAAQELRRTIHKAIFGPGDYLLPILLSDPDRAEHSLNKIVGNAAISAFERVDPGASSQELIAAARSLRESLDDLDNRTEAEDAGDSQFVTITSTLVPFGLSSYNGSYDPLDGSIQYQMSLQAARFEPVVFKATMGGS